MADQLSIYNGALRECKSRKTTLTEVREARYLLDDVWGDGGVTKGGIRFCLEEGFWTFATRTVEVGFDPDFQWSFGYSYSFTLPPDFVKLSGVYQDEFGNVPLTQYKEEGGAILANIDTIFISYISNDPAYGLNLTGWPESFNLMVERYFAMRIILRITKSEQAEKDMIEKYNHAARDARSKSAMEQPTKFYPQGSFVRSRQGSFPGSGRSRFNGS